MKKSTFLQGAFIATVAIFVSKILGVLYVIPFYKIIGEESGALYGYAYIVYSLFLMLSGIGLPLAISKMVSEYNALGYLYSKERAYKVGKVVIYILGITMFIVLMVSAPILAKWVKGDIVGGDSVEDITFVIRVISTAILVAPYISLARGYLQGHKYIAVTSYSQVIEQVIRVTVILAGSYLALYVFHLEMKYAIGAALLGATIGAIGACIYMALKIKKHRTELVRDTPRKEEEKEITDKFLLKKLIMYALPFIMVSLTVSVYEFVDMMTINRTLVSILNYDAIDAQTIVAVITTWGEKLNTIVSSIGMGIGISLLPNITSSFVEGNNTDVKQKINQTIQIILYLTLPLTIFLSLVAGPVFGAFYGVNKWGPAVFQYSIFIAFIMTLVYSTTVMVQVLNKYKVIFFSLLIGTLLNVILKIPFMILFENMGFNGYAGAIISTFIGYSVSFFINLAVLRKHMKVDYKSTVNKLMKIGYSVIIMIATILLLKSILPVTANRFANIGICALYGIVSFGIYFAITFWNKTFSEVFGNNFITNIINKFKKS